MKLACSDVEKIKLLLSVYTVNDVNSPPANSVWKISSLSSAKMYACTLKYFSSKKTKDSKWITYFPKVVICVARSILQTDYIYM